MKLFDSQDSRYMLKSALMITVVPILMLGAICYSLWLLMAVNFSYFKSVGLVIAEPAQEETFLLYLFKSQIDYLPYLGLFLIGVFFLGLVISYLILRPFNEMEEMCATMLQGEATQRRLEGLNSKKLLIRLGHFLGEYVSAKKAGKSLPLPEALASVKGPSMDYVFGFQFLCMMILLAVITVTSINFFTTELYDDLTEVALRFLQKPPKGLDTFLLSQKGVIDLIVTVPSLVACLMYAFIARVLMVKVEGVTYAYIRDVRDVVSGQYSRRLRPRADDPGKNAAAAINQVLDSVYPQPNNASAPSVEASAILSPV